MFDVGCWTFSAPPFCFLLSQLLLFPCRLLHSPTQVGRNPLASEAQLLEEFNRRDDGNAEGFLQDQQTAILSD